MVADVERRHHEDDVFGDVGRVVADPFEMSGDQDQVERGFNRSRILQHVIEQLAEDLRFEPVQPVVFIQDRLGEHRIAPHERVGDHATNIAEDVIFIVEARDIRHHATDSSS